MDLHFDKNKIINSVLLMKLFTVLYMNYIF